MTQKQHVIHGRDHRPNGADPIPGIGGAVEWEDVGTGTDGGGGIQFGIENVGDWLHITTTEDISLTAGDGSSIQFYGTDFLFQGDGADSTDFVVGNVGIVLLNSSGGSLRMGSATSLDGIDLTTNYGPIDITSAAGGPITLWPHDDFIVKGRPGSSISGAWPILRVTHDPAGVAPPTYHIRTGATWVADL